MAEILEKSQAEVAELKIENDRLKQRIRLLEKALFGPKSERIIELNDSEGEFDQLSTELDEQNKEIEVNSHKKRKKKSNLADQLPEDLSEEEIVLDLPEEEKEGLIKIGEERSRKLAKKPASYYIKVYVRPKYADKKYSATGVMISDLPDFAISGSQFDESIIANTAVNKYAYHLPLYRIEEKMKYEGIPVSRQTLCHLISRGAEVLKPVYDEL